MKQRERDAIIKELAEDFVDCIEQARSYRMDVAIHGHTGYIHMLDEELLEAYREAFGEDFLTGEAV